MGRASRERQRHATRRKREEVARKRHVCTGVDTVDSHALALAVDAHHLATREGVFKDRDAYDRSCELTIYVDHLAKGCGYGRALYEELEKQLAEQGMLNLYACIADPIEEDEYLTRDSERFHAHLGFEKVGEFHKCGYKFGRWYNMIWMEKLIGEHVEETTGD